MNCPLSASPPECLKERRRVFQQGIYPWHDNIRCENCKAGISFERQEAESRPVVCSNCWKPISEETQSGMCTGCSHNESRVFRFNDECKLCKAPIMSHSKSKICTDCRNSGKHLKRKYSCRDCGGKINNQIGLCYHCRVKRGWRK